MRISSKGRYGLRAMIELASQDGKGPVLLKDVAEAQGLPLGYLEQIISPLRKAGLVRSFRGARGGYQLARAPEQINALEIVEALEGPLAPLDCVTEPRACDRAPGCAARDLWCRLHRAMADTLSRTTLAQLVEEQRSYESATHLLFHI